MENKWQRFYKNIFSRIFENFKRIGRKYKLKKRKKKTKIFIAVDGGSASGKTTAAEFLSSYYNINFLSSGRLYRYCALKIINKKNNYNKLFINKIIKSLKDKSLKNYKLYNKEVTKKSSEIAKVKYIRESSGVSPIL